MDATLNIIVRVAAKQAISQLAATQKAVHGVNTAAAAQGFGKYAAAVTAAGRANANFAANLQSSKLINHGKNLNWVGRQLIYNFTLPLVLAGAALFKFNQDIERSMVQVRKVYGDLRMSEKQVQEETDALSKSFELLSTRFGVAQTEVIDIAAAFASAGSAGVGLANNTRAAMELMILGEMEAVDASTALVAIQAQWRLSTLKNEEGVSDLTKAMAILNVVENETAAKMSDLVQVFAKSSGVARAGGVTIRELAAMTAALIPAAGNASEAGNMLKTVISRMGKPTREMIDALGKMNIVVTDPEWMGSTATQKLQRIADGFTDLTSAQRDMVSSALAGRRQVSRFNILMQEMGDTQGYYARALEASADEALNLATYQRELNTVLESNPRKWDIMTNAIRNSLAAAFIPLMPAIMSLVGLFARLAKAFSDMDPQTQKIILFTLATIAVVGPLLSLAGSLMQLIGVFKIFGQAIFGVFQLIGVSYKVFRYGLVMMARTVSIALPAIVQAFGVFALAVKQAVWVASYFLGAFAAAVGLPLWAVVAILVAVAAAIAAILTTDIEDPFIRAFRSIVSGITQLPSIFARVFNNVISVLGRAIEIIIDYLSYLNPFARHSPSLVDNVQAGIAVILNEYDKLKTIPATVARALASLVGFNVASSGDRAGFREAELNEVVSSVAAENPVAGAAAADMAKEIIDLEALLPALSAEIVKQRIEVARLAAAYDQADAAVDAATKALDAIQDQMAAVSDEIDVAQGRLNELANMKIDGMTAMEDAIFANSMAQKKLNLELLQYEKAGYSIDKIRDRMADLAGDIEMLRGVQTDLREKGAGSDILGVYEDEIDALEAQRGPLEGIAGEIAAISDELDRLDIEGQILELTQSITFDPLLREIDKLVNGVEEMSFEDIMAGIAEQQKIIADLEAAYIALEEAEKAAKAVVDSTTSERDKIGEALDAEKDKLDALEQAYADIESLIRQMESAMTDYVDAAKAAAEIDKAKKEAKQSPIEELFDAAAAGDYEIAGGGSVLGAEGGLIDIEQFNEDLERELQAALESMGTMNIGSIWADLKTKIVTWWSETWTGLVDWVKDNWVRLLGAALLGAVAVALGAPALIAAAAAALGYMFVSLTRPVWDWTWEHIIQPIGEAFGAAGGWIGENLITPFMEAFTTVATFLQTIWDTVLWPVFELIGSSFAMMWSGITAAIQLGVDLIGVALEILRGIWEGVWFLIGDYVKASWDTVSAIFGMIIDFYEKYLTFAVETFVVVVQIAWELIKLAIQAGWDFLSMVGGWIWDKLKWVGEKFIWMKDFAVEGFQGIQMAVKDLYDKYIKKYFEAIESIIRTVWENIGGVFSGAAALFGVIVDALRNVYNTGIKPIMNAIGMIFATVWNAVLSATSTAINFFIGMFNIIGGAINKVAELLNIDARISTIAEVTFEPVSWGMDSSAADRIANPVHGGGGGNIKMMAEGGILGKMGGVTKDIRAIVGEGSDVHPEYVIPTDPKFRDRAKGLYNQLGQTLGMGDDGFSHMDLFGDIGGAISSGFNTAKDAVGAVGGFIKDKAIALLWAPLKALGQAALNLIPKGIIRDIGSSVFNAVDGWITGAGSAWDQESANRKPPAAVSGPGGWMAILQMLAGAGIPHKFLSGFRPGAVTRNTGQPSWHGKNRAVDVGSAAGTFPSSYSPSQLLAINHAIYDAYKPQLLEMIYGGPGAKNVFRGRDHRFSSKLMAEHVNHVHAAMARGGFVVPRSTGGSLFRIGEGLHNEAVQVTPLQGKGGDGSATVNNFYGDLSFPNITNADDAEQFIRNLEALAS